MKTPSLCRKELQVIQLIGLGMTNRMVGRRPDVSEGTIKAHAKHIFSKLRVTSRVEATLEALRLGIIDFRRNGSSKRMRVVSRAIGQGIQIGKAARLTILDMNDDQVRVGIVALRNISVELHETI